MRNSLSIKNFLLVTFIIFSFIFIGHVVSTTWAIIPVHTLKFDDKNSADGLGVSDKLDYSVSIAVDGIGNIYVADGGNNQIRKIDSAGNVTILAGDGTAGFADGKGTSAKFNNPSGIAVDRTGNIYVTDRGNNQIRKIDSEGNVTTLLLTQADYDAKSTRVKLGRFIGTIGGFEGTDVVVNGKDTIGRQAPIGRSLIIDAGGEYIYLQSTFPMQTVVKCRVIKGDRSKIQRGMKVYLKQ